MQCNRPFFWIFEPAIPQPEVKPCPGSFNFSWWLAAFNRPFTNAGDFGHLFAAESSRRWLGNSPCVGDLSPGQLWLLCICKQISQPILLQVLQCCALQLSGYIWADKKFQFGLNLHSIHQVSPREGASVTAHSCYQVKYIAFKPQNHLWDKLGVLQKPLPSMWTETTKGMDCNLWRSSVTGKTLVDLVKAGPCSKIVHCRKPDCLLLQQ